VEALTLHPADGDARKEILFTRKGKVLYAILPMLPRKPAGTLIVRDLELSEHATVRLLGNRSPVLPWQKFGKDVLITLPPIPDGVLPFEGPLVVKINGLAD